MFVFGGEDAVEGEVGVPGLRLGLVAVGGRRAGGEGREGFRWWGGG